MFSPMTFNFVIYLSKRLSTGKSDMARISSLDAQSPSLKYKQRLLLPL